MIAPELFLLLPILAYFFFAVTSSVDKHLINRKISPLVVGSAKNLIVSLMLFAAILAVAPESFLAVDGFGWAVIIITAFVGIGATVFFYRSLKLEEISRFVPYYQSVGILLPFIVIIILLNEVVNIYNVFGAVLVIAGVYASGSRKFELPKYVKEVHLTALFNAAALILIKLSAVSVFPLIVSFVYYLVTGLAMMHISKIDFADLGKFKSPINAKYLLLAAVGSFLGTSALVFALSFIEGSLVFPVAGLYVLLVTLFGGLWLKEKDLKSRIIGALLIVLGIYGVYL